MFRAISLLIFTCIVFTKASVQFPATYSATSNNETAKKIQYRLPDTAKPLRYELEITDLKDLTSKKGREDNFTFTAMLRIDLEITKDTKNLTLHSKELYFEEKNVRLEPHDNSETKYVDVNFDKDTDFVHFTAKKDKLKKGRYTLVIDKYVGKLNDDMRGFYRSSYKDDNNETKWLATTHFEPVGARRAFPCFDEPAYKAIFQVTIHYEKPYKAISNTPPKSERFDVTVFEETPPMSTYLLAFVVSDFKKRSSNSAENFTVYARPNAIQHCNLALEKGELILKKLDEFTGIPFRDSIPKMDQVAIPDFAAGAMENWGLVLYREKSLLFDEKVGTTNERQNVVETIAHEFAHQWFGNLVSPKWWKYIWLNEGFANFFQTYITEKVLPEWRSIDQSVVKSIQTTAFNADSGAKAHKLNQDVESPEEISAIFDSISYQKGGAVIRMMQHFLTEKVFQKGLQQYLKKNAKNVATSDELFEALSAAAIKAKINVKEIMDTWVEHKGYPVLKVSRNYEAKKFEVKQERFYNYEATEEEKKEDSKHKWHVPINYVTQANVNFTETTAEKWLKNTSMTIEDQKIDAGHWLILNKQQTGYYRVNYDNANWNLIIKYLNSDDRENIHVLNRAQLINDALAFAQLKQMNFTTFLHLTAHLTNITDYIAWYPGFKTLTWLDSKLVNTDYYGFFKEYAFNVTRNVANKVKYEETKEDEHLTKLNRIPVIHWSCLLGDMTCIKKMEKKVTDWVDPKSKETISPDLLQITLCHGLRNASFELWNATLTKLIETEDNLEENNLIMALGCSENREILENYLKFTFADKSPLNDDAFKVLRSVHQHGEVGINVALDFVTKKFVTVLRRIVDDARMTSIFTEIGEKITTSAQLDKLKELRNLDDPLISMTKKGIEAAEKNIQWFEEHKTELAGWKAEFHPNGAGLLKASVGLMATLLLIVFSNLS